MTSDPARWQRVKQVIGVALELQGSERATYLERACAGDAELRVDVERLLAAEHGSSTMAEALDAGAHVLAGADEGAAVPEWIGHYRLLSEIGRGGQATVFLAEDTKLERKVALKLLFGHVAISREQVLRFKREAAAASKLDHPGICPVYDAGEIDGVPYIAMRYVEGETLAQWIVQVSRKGTTGTETPPSTRDHVQQVCALIEKTARALHFAHERGLIHRDIKPANLMLSSTGDPVILDFGLARDELAEAQALTHSGDLLGTPAYMSPEQLTAQRVPLDRRTDVYSLGATLYECLTLTRPFTAATRPELYHRILTAAPTPPSSVNRRIPRDLQVVVETAMDKDRDRRYQTAADLAEDLRHVREYEPIRARPISRLLRARRWAQRNPAVATGLVALVLLLVTGLVVSAFHLRRMARELEHSRALNLVAASVQELDGDPALALKLAVAAVELEASPATLSQLYSAMAAQHEIAVFQADARRLFFRKSVALSAKNDLVLTRCRSNTVRVWRRAGQAIRTLSHEARVEEAGFSNDGTRILTVTRRAARCFSVDGELLSKLEFDGMRLQSAAWSSAADPTVQTVDRDGALRVLTPSGDVLLETEGGWGSRNAQGRPVGFELVSSPFGRPALVSGAKVVFAWKDGKPIVVDHGAHVQLVAFDPRGELVATAGLDNVARLWTMEGEQVAGLRAHTYRMFSIEFSPSGDRIVTASEDQSARVWQRDGKPIGIVHHEAPVRQAAFVGSSSRVLTSSADGTLRLSTATGSSLLVLRGHRGAVGRFDMLAARGLVLSHSADGTARLWSLRGVEPFHLLGPDDRPWNLDSTAAGEVVAAFASGRLVAWDPQGRVQRIFESEAPTPLHGVAVATDRSTVVAGGVGRTFAWRWQTGERLWQQPFVERDDRPWPNAVWPITILPRARTALVAGTSAVANLIDFGGDAPRGIRLAPYCRFVAASPDGRLIALAGRNAVRLCDSRGKELAELAARDENLRGVGFDPQGRLLVTASDDRTAKVWNVDAALANPAGAASLLTLRGHPLGLRCATFAPDGKRILTADDATSRVWDLEGNELFRLPSGRQSRFSRDGKWILLPRFGGALRLPASEQDLLRLARKWAERPLRDMELSRYEELLGGRTPVRAR